MGASSAQNIKFYHIFKNYLKASRESLASFLVKPVKFTMFWQSSVWVMDLPWGIYWKIIIKSELIWLSTALFFIKYCKNNSILLLWKNMVWILLQKRKIMFFESSKIQMFWQYFLKNNAVEIQISLLLIIFPCFFKKTFHL